MATFRSLSPFGVEVLDAQIGSLSEVMAGDIKSAIERHRVAVFRNQNGGDAELVGFLKQLGDLTFTEGETPVSGAQELNFVSNIGRTTPPRSVFHSDTSYVAQPPAFGALRAVIVPESGGSTVFSDQVGIVRGLPLRTRNFLKNRTLLHAFTGADGVVHSARHPILRMQPSTGETALYLSTPERCSAMSGISRASSARLIDVLYQKSISAFGLYTHHWRQGDVIVWDNRTTMHRAEHCDVNGDRVLHRGLVLGEIPIAAELQ